MIREDLGDFRLMKRGGVILKDNGKGCGDFRLMKMGGVILD